MGQRAGAAIGWYVHHQGAGHLTRARAVCQHLPSVTVLSSLSRPEEGGPWSDWVELDLDTGDPVEDPTAGGVLHWAPRRHPGLASRMTAIADWVRESAPAALVVDVSVEVALLARLLGTPVVTFAMPGDRSDLPHRLGHALAERILAPWSPEVLAPAHLAEWGDKVVHTGAVSRFEGSSCPAGASTTSSRRLLLLAGNGGSSLQQDDVQRLQRALPQWDVAAVGGGLGWTDDVWGALCAADVVVSHAGQGALADVAAAGRPAVVVPEARPYDEQGELARALDRAGLAVSRPTWSEVTAQDVERAVSSTTAWDRWGVHGASARVARAILEVAEREPSS